MAKKKAAKKKQAKAKPSKKAATSVRKKAAKKKGTKKKESTRELIAPRGDKRFVRRDEQGQFKESDDVGRSLSSDQRKKAKRSAKPGQGDRGDRRG